MTEFLPLVFTSGWASGVNAYATVLLLGLLGRFAGIDGIPPALERTEVLIAAAALYVIEFVADKIPYIDSGWDAISTAIRPTVGAILGLLIVGDATSLEQAIGATIGGSSALLSHLAKAGMRLAANTSPEPVSNIALSVTEDFSVAGVITLAVFHPVPALIIAAILLVVSATLVVILARKVRRGFRRWRQRRSQALASP
ncbi:DUF4126 domain-containing protein [Tenggerimyces flavus]|uniref:DUF4126 domain-containing protein n=1 Tax=Tenggerimyces flavus TaxID=1708749 RepID=A0ABV7Y549_9ACTN|nr:DUF4126 domain-containing protein [Tenggerimyces flavus]MBM7788615.1 O-antigen/teichoic acid export membrane protein [Tenggerimyces flavus]